MNVSSFMIKNQQLGGPLGQTAVVQVRAAGKECGGADAGQSSSCCSCCRSQSNLDPRAPDTGASPWLTS